MRIYVCARYGRKEEARNLAEQLQDLHHEVTSSWCWQVEDEMGYEAGKTEEYAAKDIYEIGSSDLLVYLSEEESNPWGRGGRHVEFGMALAFEIGTAIVGPRENIFHYLPEVRRYDEIEDFLSDMRRER